MKSDGWQNLVRGMLGLVAAGSVPALSAVGYTGGVETSVGIDAGTVRDLTAVGIALLAVYFPQVSQLVKMATSSPRLDALETRVAKLEGVSVRAESADVIPGKSPA